jgi:hypothetical protein
MRKKNGHTPKTDSITMTSNPCIRCGQERIVIKTWKETVGTSVITFSESKCPDPDCQKIVDKANKEREDKRQLRLNNKLHAKTTKNGFPIFRI